MRASSVRFLTLPIIFFTTFFITTGAKAQTCNVYPDLDSYGMLTKQCLNEILTAYVNKHSKGFFIITVSDVENVYVQGTPKPQSNDQFYFEAVGAKYSTKVTEKITQDLVKLGWTSDIDGNFNTVLTVDQFFNNQAADLLYDTLITYDEQYADKKLTYFVTNE